MDITQDLYNSILEAIMPVLMKNGLKATTMDSIAAKLQMSTRTLYEIFGSKEDMFIAAHKYFHSKMAEEMKKTFTASQNVMEAIIKCFLYNRDLMEFVSADFIRDLEQFANQDISVSENRRRHHYQNLFDVLQKGVEEGYFRDDINLQIQCRMLIIQMEALKRTEELFPSDISLLEVYDSSIIGFLRGISSYKGLEEIEKFMPLILNKTTQTEN